MAHSYMPRSQGLALAWMKTFAGTIAANPGVYQLSPADGACLLAAVQAFDAAYAIAVDPHTATRSALAVKDTARVSAERVCQQYYSLIKPNAGISDAAKIAIGVRPLNRGRSRIECPATSPMLRILGATPASHTLRYSDMNTPDSGGKPFGAAALQLFVAIEEKAVSDVNAGRFYGSFTRNPAGVGFAHADDGKVATYWGRWTGRRGDVGPWSNPVSMRIAA